MVRLLALRLARPHRPGLPRFRLNDRAIAALLLNCPDASDGKLDSRLACAYAHAGSTNEMCGQTRQCGSEADGGGRGFISSTRSRPATVPVLMRRNHFLVPKRLIYFPEIKHFKR